MKQHKPCLTDPQLRQLIAAHIDDDSFCSYVIQQDINGIALDLREAYRDDFFSAPEDNLLKGFLQAVDEAASPDSDPEQAALAFICKRLRLKWKRKLSLAKGEGYIAVDRDKLVDMTKDRLEYLYHNIGYQSMILKLCSKQSVVVDLMTDYVEYDWSE